MRRRLAGLLVKESIQFLRNRAMLVLILWLYTVEVIICTLALSFEVREMPIAVVDLDRTPGSRRLVENFVVTDAFRPVAWLDSADAAEDALQAGRARLALVVPRGFQRALARGKEASVQVLIDATNSNIAAQARTYASRTLQQALLLSFFGLFPLMFLSGTLVPVESMPEALQTLSLGSPLRHYMDVILGIFLKGSSLGELWPQGLALTAIGVPLFLIAAQVFDRTSA